jgi:ferredoxin
MTKTATTQRLRVNPLACEAHGVCIEALPEMIANDPWGYPVLSGHPVPAHLLAHARRAVATCPTLALSLVDTETAATTNAAARR